MGERKVGKGYEKHVINGTILDLHSFKVGFQDICGLWGIKTCLMLDKTQIL